MPYDDDEKLDKELTLIDIFNIFWKRKFLIISITVLAAVASIVYALTRPTIYRAVSRILNSGSSRSSIVSGLGSFASLVGLSTGSETSVMLGIMKINFVLDSIIDEYDLMTLYSTDVRQSARNRLAGGLEIAPVPGSGGIIEVAYLDQSPDFAAEMANAFVIAAQAKMQEIAIEDAQRKKNFFEIQLAQAQQELSEAEDAMINYQQSKGLLSFESQTDALLTAMNDLKKSIASKNAEIASLKSYARRDNPKLKLAQSQLDGMIEELRKLEAEQIDSSPNISSAIFSGETARSAIGDLPELGVEYQRYARALRFANAKYESMLTQYESAKLSEVNDLSGIFVLDLAEPPQIKFAPRRSRMVILGTGIGFIGAIMFTFIFAHIQALLKGRDEQEDYDDDDDEEEEEY